MTQLLTKIDGRITVWARISDAAPEGTQSGAVTWRDWAMDWIARHNAAVGFREWELRTRKQPDHKHIVTVGAIFVKGV